MSGAQWARPGSPSNATDDRGQGRQIWTLPPIELMTFTGDTETGVDGSAEFRVEVPDSRLRVNIAIIGEPDLDYEPTGATNEGQPNFIGTKGLTLWLRAVEDSIRSGQEIPITNLWGTQAVPGAIPGYVDETGTIVADTALGGWGKEFVTIGKAICGTVDYPVGVNNGAGQLVLQVRYIAEGFRIPREEWLEMRGEMSAALKGYPLRNAV